VVTCFYEVSECRGTVAARIAIRRGSSQVGFSVASPEPSRARALQSPPHPRTSFHSNNLHHCTSHLQASTATTSNDFCKDSPKPPTTYYLLSVSFRSCSRQSPQSHCFLPKFSRPLLLPVQTSRHHLHLTNYIRLHFNSTTTATKERIKNRQ